MEEDQRLEPLISEMRVGTYLTKKKKRTTNKRTKQLMTLNQMYQNKKTEQKEQNGHLFSKKLKSAQTKSQGKSKWYITMKELE